MSSGEKKHLRRLDISAKAKDAVDLAGRYPQIVRDIAYQTGFRSKAEEPFSVSTWWGQKIGAVIYRGNFATGRDMEPAVLKIEGVKGEPDEATEIEMIKHAKVALQGSGIRPPEIFQELPWTDANGGYSAVIMEDVIGIPVLPIPGTREQIVALLAVRDQYRRALRRDNGVMPWVENEGTVSDALAARFANWQQSSLDIFPHHPFRKLEDAELVQRALAILKDGYRDVQPEFMQGHFSHRDIVRSGEGIVMFSNLYWSYRAPFYDIVFPYHWYMLELAGQPGMTVEKLRTQQSYWEEEFIKREQKMSPEEKRLFRLARIERLAAGVNIDAFLVSSDPNNRAAAFSMESMRDQLLSLLVS